VNLVRHTCAVGALVLVAFAPPARAVEIGAVRVARAEDQVAITLRMGSVLSPRVRDSLERGMPATVDLGIDVWRVRNGWFDQLVRSERATFGVTRNAWSDEYQMRRQSGPVLTLLDLDEVEREFDRPIRMRVLPLASLEPEERYYAIVRVVVKPLTVEDIEEVERWLSGEAKRAGKPGPGSIARLPTYMLGVLANLAGLGDESVTYRTVSFRRADL
jgi:hypothetical protein